MQNFEYTNNKSGHGTDRHGPISQTLKTLSDSSETASGRMIIQFILCSAHFLLILSVLKGALMARLHMI